jgi:hypothetical protein
MSDRTQERYTCIESRLRGTVALDDFPVRVWDKGLESEKVWPGDVVVAKGSLTPRSDDLVVIVNRKTERLRVERFEHPPARLDLILGVVTEVRSYYDGARMTAERERATKEGAKEVA